MKCIKSDLSKTLSSLPSGLEITIAIHITGPQDVSELPHSDSSSGDTTPVSPISPVSEPFSPISEKDCAPSAIEGVKIYAGRPDVLTVLEDVVSTATGPVSVDGASLAVFCGETMWC